jgi:hypothetical protein
MSTKKLIGNAGFQYGAGPTTHQLATPLLWELVPVAVRTRFRRWSLDRTAVDTVVIGAGVEDLLTVIRFDDQPVGLRAMLKAGMDGTQLDYYPDLALATFYPFLLVEVDGADGDEVRIRPDRDRFMHGEWEASVRLRRVDGGTVDGLL